MRHGLCFSGVSIEEISLSQEKSAGKMINGKIIQQPCLGSFPMILPKMILP